MGPDYSKWIGKRVYHSDEQHWLADYIKAIEEIQ